MIGGEIQSAHQKIFIHNPVKYCGNCGQNFLGGRSETVQIDRAVGMLGDIPPVAICYNCTAILHSPLRAGEIF